MRRLAFGAALAVCLPGAAPAQEPAATYCGGSLVAERFETQVGPPPRGLVTYSVVLRNGLDQDRSFVLVVTATLFQRPSSAPRTIPAGGTTTVELGYQAWQSGVAPLRGDRLAQVTRISCR
ncbi:hypothetical protein EJV46_03915 [Roseococcus sp. SYP-B2431]|uniref:hypothetical protein n=1 Tax=Roseococcus sp. SYP-B2431 TaxID=2496640 RepID=UPI00103B13AF|nr:hypothetical protein [Roseococcus sp. SYP-B2431]TCH99825.1 hypothetical protein EJV46_03915 [Roseococcus sp. SYP-B2431]